MFCRYLEKHADEIAEAMHTLEHELRVSGEINDEVGQDNYTTETRIRRMVAVLLNGM